MNQKQQIKAQKIKAKEHIKRMEAIIKATEPFVTQDKSMDFQNCDMIGGMRQVYQSAIYEIQWTKERMCSDDQ